MRLSRSLSFASISTAARLGAALIAFSVVARVLGPERFGVLMVAMSVATLFALVASFGLSTQLLREIGRTPAAAPALVAEALGARLLASVAILAPALGALPWLPPPARLPYLLLLGAMWLEGLAELANAGLRARQRYDAEARIALASALLNAGGVAVVAWSTADLVAIACAYLVTRAVAAGLVWRGLVGAVGPVRRSGPAAAWRRLRAAVSYAVDSVLTSAFGLVDSVVLNHLLGPAAVGLHQAGMRLFLAGTQAATVLANVFLPRAAAAHAAGGEAAGAEYARLQFTFLAVGAGLGLAMAVAAPWYVVLLFGDSYLQLVSLMPWFGLLFTVKFCAAAWGVVLTARGLQSYRASASALHWLVVAALALRWVPAYGNPGWLFALLVGNGLLGAAYAARAMRSGRDARTLGVTALALAAFVPLLHWP